MLVSMEIDNELDEEKLYCRECQAASMKNDFAVGKLCPTKRLEEGIPKTSCRV